ncbi:hypothetical protein [Streptomyces sp. NPDC001665]
MDRRLPGLGLRRPAAAAVHLEEDELDGLVHDHPDDPQALADAFTAAARAGEKGYRDDATAVVLRHHR